MIGNTYTRLTGFFFSRETQVRASWMKSMRCFFRSCEKICKQTPLSKVVGTAKDERPFFKKKLSIFFGILVLRRTEASSANSKFKNWWFSIFSLLPPEPNTVLWQLFKFWSYRHSLGIQIRWENRCCKLWERYRCSVRETEISTSMWLIQTNSSVKKHLR